MSAENAMLVVEDVSINFGGIQALANVSFTVRKGEIVSLIGPNGAGKTTLLTTIAGGLLASSGVIAFEGQPIQGRPSHEVNRLGIARTFQAAEVFTHLSVRENVIAGGVASSGLGFVAGFNRWGKVRRVYADLARMADEALAFVGLHGMEERPAASLPAGQQRLLGIARALATNPKLMLLDEPGAGLNESEKAALVDVIRRLSAQGITIILVEHDMGVVGQLSDRIVVLDQGVMIAAGEPAEVKSDPRVIEAYLGKGSEPKSRAVTPLGAERRQKLLEVRELEVHYDGVVALDRVSLEVKRGEIVAILGANGAGKSTLLKAIAGLAPASAGEIAFDGQALTGRPADTIVRAGVSLTPEGRELFPSLSVEDNLLLGRYARMRESRGLLSLLMPSAGERRQLEERLESMQAIFPILKERRDQYAGTLSGGQAQMLAIARSLMNDPVLLMLDEPSLGLAPQIVDGILETLVELRERGLTILLVEQNAKAALRIADRAYVLSTGQITAEGDALDMLNDEKIASAYLGAAEGNASAQADLRVSI